MARTTITFIICLRKGGLSGAPPSLKRYSMVNQEMQTASMSARFGLSIGWFFLSHSV